MGPAAQSTIAGSSLRRSHDRRHDEIVRLEERIEELCAKCLLLALVPIALAKVCFEEKSGSGADSPPCRTLTQLRHWAANFAVMHNAACAQRCARVWSSA